MKLSRPTLLLTIALACGLTLGCGDSGPVTPGSVTAKWKLPGIATCESLGLESLQISALQSGDTIGAAISPCPPTADSGTITLDELQPGTYTIEIAGLDDVDEATHVGSALKIKVAEGADTSFEELGLPAIQLSQKPASIQVDWSLQDGKRCAQAGVTEVTVTIFGDDGLQLPGIEPKTVACEAVYEDPETGLEQTGVMFANVAAIDALIVFAAGKDDSKAIILEGQTETLALKSGQTLKVLIQLTTP